MTAATPSSFDPESGSSPWRLPVAVASLMATPLLVFVSSANTLYLRNQSEFQHQPQVLTSFIELTLVTLLIGLALYALSKYQPFRLLLHAYYMVGPFFLLFGFLHNWAVGSHFFLWVFDTWAGVLTYFAGFVAATVFVSRRFSPSTLAGPFAAFSLLLLATEAHSFVTHYEKLAPETAGSQIPNLETNPNLPNVYHFIFDGYDAEHFPQTLSSDYRNALSGFVNFPKNLALYRNTRSSLPSIFSGRRRPGNVSNPEYLRRALNTDFSFLYWLKEEGYKTVAYTPDMYEFGLELFDHVTFHQQNHGAEALLEMNNATFQRLWLWTNSPRLFTGMLLDTEWFIEFGGEDLRLVKNRNFLPFSVPIRSYLSFLNVLEQEADLPANGRYTLIHLVLPHSPEVLAADCSYDVAGSETTQLEQAGCATKLLVDFVERLKELGRFDNSLVIAQADHGVYEPDNGAENPAERVSLHALLLINPIGSDGEFAVSSVNSTLIDIAPTLLGALEVENQLQMDGTPLQDAMPDNRLVPMD